MDSEEELNEELALSSEDDDGAPASLGSHGLDWLVDLAGALLAIVIFVLVTPLAYAWSRLRDK